MIIFHKMIGPNIDECDLVLGNLINFIMQYGIPKKIRVRDFYTNSILYDVCEELKIKLEISERLHGIYEFVKSFNGMY